MEIVTTKKFDKQFRRQSVKIKKEFEKRIALFLSNINNPILNIHKLSGKLKDQWSFNVSGDIRVVYDISYDNIVILVAIGSHSELYS
ncbi:type II toxin-antitoxin system mRNA interferase toxin, RelE/StbE family [bacterium]|jgi:addiction module RelE/StbE family toxin|nr:type II toxin-antitoxin system mRNA interferase toxin, RelE/StbE family [bacterium]MBT3730328.1 type II toxin-antitoxin system mRNA interferase toxin, RelE/StbE family [bacterium]MBT4894499.1 type II toxin-antitoxin system mRNA interferase toxin, RelE/StbE family [bacterium]